MKKKYSTPDISYAVNGVLEAVFADIVVGGRIIRTGSGGRPSVLVDPCE